MAEPARYVSEGSEVTVCLALVFQRPGRTFTLASLLTKTTNRLPSGRTAFSPRLKIFERIDQIIKEVPTESWAELPRDGAANIDHYLYGAPKTK
jgi:hypothetical protein